MKKQIASFLFGIPFAVFIATAIAVPAGRASEPAVRTLNGAVLPTTHAIRVENKFGSVTVQAVDQGFGWDWRLQCGTGTPAENEKFARDCSLEVHQTEGTLELILLTPDQHAAGAMSSAGVIRHFISWALGGLRTNGPTIQSELQLRVPRSVTLDVKNRFGGVRIAGTRGSVTIDCQNGGVEVLNIDGTVLARTTFAPLRAENTRSAQLTTQNGSLDAQGIDGDLNATASFAKMRVHDVTGGAELKNQNGSIDVGRVTGGLVAATSFAELRVEKTGAAQLTTQNGGIDAQAIAGNLRATASFAKMRVSDVAGDAELKNQNGSINAVHVTGDLIARTSFADLWADEIGGTAALKCQNGKIEAHHVGGDVIAANSFAPLRVSEIAGAAQLDAQNGEIAAVGMKGNIRAETSFGKMRLEGTSRRFVARNQNGAVEITARSPGVERIEASASFASIDVRLPVESKPLIRASASFGKVQSDFPVLLSESITEARFAADVSPLKINLKGQNGDIRILQLASK